MILGPFSSGASYLINLAVPYPGGLRSLVLWAMRKRESRPVEEVQKQCPPANDAVRTPRRQHWASQSLATTERASRCALRLNSHLMNQEFSFALSRKKQRQSAFIGRIPSRIPQICGSEFGVGICGSEFGVGICGSEFGVGVCGSGFEGYLYY
ncbi:hypothetical protein B0H19DRAFT_1085802 [Mycena capillaripes]|nr:hypothetical protein B0H19DRAFT_1085802 [Mycena capillaripes]